MLRPKAVRFKAVLAIAATLTCLSSLPLSPQGLALLPATAHEVEISEDIGGTLHIEPNDTPRAGEEVLAWIALRSRGGEIIGLDQCDCRLDVYTEPKQPNSAPLVSPELSPVEGDGIQGIPGAEFTFPNVGLYTLVMTGSPKQSADFSPFELVFDVTVAAGVSASSTPAADTPPEIPETADAEVATEETAAEETAAEETAAEEIATEVAPEPEQRPILLLFFGGMAIGAVGFWLIRRT